MSSKFAPLSRRYMSGRPALSLNAVQMDAREGVLKKIKSGEYCLVTKRCPLCDSDDGTVVASKEMYGLPCETAVCKNCNFVFGRRQLSGDSLGKFYANEYRKLDRGREFPGAEFFDLQYGKGALIDVFLRESCVPLPPNSLILEVGCGAGGILAHFKELGHQVVGFDLGREYLDYGRERSDLNLHEGNLERAISFLKAEGKSPKLIIYEQVLEHISDPVAELTQLREFVSGDAILFVGVPGLRNIDQHYDSNVLRYLQIPHLVHFELTTLVRAAKLAGFSLIAGNEVVRAVFRPTHVGDEHEIFPSKLDRADHLDEPEMVLYLRNMEGRWKVKSRRPVMEQVRGFALRCARRVRRALRGQGRF